MFAFRHLVQTATRFGAPFTVTRIFWMLGFQRRRVRLWEWEMLFPNPGVFPQMSHTEAIEAEGYQILTRPPVVRPLTSGP